MPHLRPRGQDGRQHALLRPGRVRHVGDRGGLGLLGHLVDADLFLFLAPKGGYEGE
jgi:hypothetical protein